MSLSEETKFLRCPPRKGEGNKRKAETACDRRGNAGETHTRSILDDPAFPSGKKKKKPRAAVRPRRNSRGTRENFAGGNLSVAGRGRGGKKKIVEDARRPRARGTRSRKGGEREWDKIRGRVAGTYVSHVVRSRRSSLLPAATAGTAPRTSGTRYSRGRKNTRRGSSSDATRARRRFEVIYRRGCESE